MEISIDAITFLIFIIPGFTTVWSFRYFTGSKKAGDFEFLGLSFFWGFTTLLMTFLYYKLLGSQEKFQKIFESPYEAAFILSSFGFIFGWFGSLISRRKFFIKIINFLRRI